MLSSVEKQSLELLDRVMQETFKHDTSGHDYDHIRRVVNLTTRFLNSEVNCFVTLCIAYLHDVFDHKINPVDDVEAAVLEFLKELEINFFGHDEAIALGTSQIGYSIQDSVINKTEEAKLVSDADYLDAMGSFGIIRTLQYGFKTGRDLDHTLEHIPEKLFKLKGLLTSKKAKEEGERRESLLHQFYSSYLSEK